MSGMGIGTTMGMGKGIGDWNERAQHYQTRPSTEMPRKDPGPINAPVQGQVPKQVNDLLNQLLQQMVANQTPQRPILRGRAVTATGETMDWSAVGMMARILIYNAGSSTVWVAFDVPGPSVQAFTSDQSFPIPAQGSLVLELCAFQRLGLKCAGTGTASVYAIAFQTSPLNYGGSMG